MNRAKGIDRFSLALRKAFPVIFNSLIYSFIALNVVVIGLLMLSLIVIEEIRSFGDFTTALSDPPSDWITGYILVFMFNVMFVRGAIRKTRKQNKEHSAQLYKEAVERISARRQK